MNNSAAVRVIAADRITGLVTLSASRPVERETTEQHERCRSQCAGSGDRDTSSTTMKPNVTRKEPPRPIDPAERSRRHGTARMAL